MRFINGFTRDNVIGHMKTLAWVIPLTLLIWIWAEREQVQPAKDVSVPFELVSPDANRVVNNADTTLFSKDSPAPQDLRDTLQEITRAARSIRVLVDYLERHPDALLRGKPAEADATVKPQQAGRCVVTHGASPQAV